MAPLLCDFCREPGHFFRSCPHLDALPPPVRPQIVALRDRVTGRTRSPRSFRPSSPYRQPSVSAEKHTRGHVMFTEVAESALKRSPGNTRDDSLPDRTDFHIVSKRFSP